MPDVRLIDANALKTEMADDLAATIRMSEMRKTDMAVRVLNKIDEANTIDAVPVVRCRECIHRVRTNSTLGFSWCGKFGNVMRDTDFCSWGERKMDGGAEDDC